MAEPAPARPSATVVLVRGAGGPPEIFMARRHQGTAFGDVYAFPGGVLCDADRDARPCCAGLGQWEADRRLGLDSGALDYYSAAIRELFEETGVLLARPQDADGPAVNASRLASARHAMAGAGSWPAFLHEARLKLTADRLHYFGHWETPLVRNPRFSARFFLAVLPEGQEASHDGRELTDSRWLTARQALELSRAGEIKLAFPTLRNLRLLAEFQSLDSLESWARERWHSGIEKIRPVMVERNGRQHFAVPGDPDYPRDPD